MSILNITHVNCNKYGKKNKLRVLILNITHLMVVAQDFIYVMMMQNIKPKCQK